MKRNHVVVKIEDESTAPWHVAIRHDNGMLELIGDGFLCRDAAEQYRVHIESYSIGEGTSL